MQHLKTEDKSVTKEKNADFRSVQLRMFPKYDKKWLDEGIFKDPSRVKIQSIDEQDPSKITILVAKHCTPEVLQILAKDPHVSAINGALTQKTFRVRTVKDGLQNLDPRISVLLDTPSITSSRVMLHSPNNPTSNSARFLTLRVPHSCAEEVLCNLLKNHNVSKVNTLVPVRVLMIVDPKEYAEELDILTIYKNPKTVIASITTVNPNGLIPGMSLEPRACTEKYFAVLGVPSDCLNEVVATLREDPLVTEINGKRTPSGIRLVGNLTGTFSAEM